MRKLIQPEITCQMSCAGEEEKHLTFLQRRNQLIITNYEGRTTGEPTLLSTESSDFPRLICAQALSLSKIFRFFLRPLRVKYWMIQRWNYTYITLCFWAVCFYLDTSVWISFWKGPQGRSSCYNPCTIASWRSAWEIWHISRELLSVWSATTRSSRV